MRYSQSINGENGGREKLGNNQTCKTTGVISIAQALSRKYAVSTRCADGNKEKLTD
jgi:hypothetical protein